MSRDTPETAIECLRTALRVAPDYADAMFNLALLLNGKPFSIETLRAIKTPAHRRA